MIVGTVLDGDEREAAASIEEPRQPFIDKRGPV